MHGQKTFKKNHEHIYQKIQQTTYKEFRNIFRSLIQNQGILLVSYYSFHIFDMSQNYYF